MVLVTDCVDVGVCPSLKSPPGAEFCRGAERFCVNVCCRPEVWLLEGVREDNENPAVDEEAMDGRFNFNPPPLLSLAPCDVGPAGAAIVVDPGIPSEGNMNGWLVDFCCSDSCGVAHREDGGVA